MQDWCWCVWIALFCVLWFVVGLGMTITLSLWTLPLELPAPVCSPSQIQPTTAGHPSDIAWSPAAPSPVLSPISPVLPSPACLHLLASACCQPTSCQACRWSEHEPCIYCHREIKNHVPYRFLCPDVNFFFFYYHTISTLHLIGIIFSLSPVPRPGQVMVLMFVCLLCVCLLCVCLLSPRPPSTKQPGP